MDENMLFIPPCCAKKVLPQAIMQAPRRALSFYTHGDITMEAFYRSIGFLLNDAPVMVVTMPFFSADTAVFFLQCFEREWITDLILTTSRDCETLVKKYLSAYADHVLYVASSEVSDLMSHIVLYNDKQSISINGPMLDSAYQKKTMAYTMLYHPRYDLPSKADYGTPLLNILIPDVLAHRKMKRDLSTLNGNLFRFYNYRFPPYEDE